ncbi:MAG: prolyl aminopeptidase [Pseudomonadota bacterium]
MSELDFFPPIEPYDSGYLKVSDLHEIYWEQSGNPDGQPVIFLHGGPGAGASATHRRFFDPAHYRIVIFDQRGAGRSRPLGEVEENTTGHLIADMERLREMLKIESWQVFGGSWGSTLALAYAETHPERVRALVLRGIFMCRESEVNWFLYGLRAFFPEVWDKLVSPLDDAERQDILRAYHKRLMHPDPAVHMPAARAWSTYEGSCSTLLPSPETVSAFGQDTMALGLARMEAHYFLNGVFLPPNSLLDNVGRIQDIPGTIVQGRYDCICPPITAFELRDAWPRAEFVLVPDAGHSAMEPGIRKALVAATEKYKELA